MPCAAGVQASHNREWQLVHPHERGPPRDRVAWRVVLFGQTLPCTAPNRKPPEVKPPRAVGSISLDGEAAKEKDGAGWPRPFDCPITSESFHCHSTGNVEVGVGTGFQISNTLSLKSAFPFHSLIPCSTTDHFPCAFKESLFTTQSRFGSAC